MASDKVKYAGIRFDVEGGADFVQNMQNIKHNMALTRQELLQLREQTKVSGSGTEELTQKSKLLSSQYEEERNRLQGLKTIYADVADQYGSNSKEAQKMAESVAKSETSLKKLERQLHFNSIELEKSRNRLYQTGEAWIQYGDKIQNAGKKMSNIGGKLSMGVTAPVLAGMGFAIKAASDLESAMAGVEKTTDLTASELKQIELQFREMSKTIPTSAAELAGIAEIAGQLGIEKENIVGFTRTIVDLGNATNLVGEEGATQFARFANITKMSQGDFDRLGSTVVALGNNYATTEAEIVEMGMRLAAAGNQAGMSEAEIMALSTTLTSLGINAEAGGSAFSKVINQIGLEVDTAGKNLSTIADVSNMTADEFSRKWKEDAVGALQLFIKGLSDTERMGMTTNQMLEELGFTEIRLSDALRRTSGNTDLLFDSVKLANQAWEENNALQKEATLRYSTSESQLQIQKNRLQDMAITIGQELLPHAVSLAENITDLVTGFTNLNPKTQEFILKLVAGAAAAGPLLKIGGKLTQGIGVLTSGVGTLMKKLGERQAVALAAESMTGLGTSMLTTNTSAGTLTGGVGGLTSALMSPAGLVAGFGALVLAFIAIKGHLDSQDEAVGRAIANTEELTASYANLRTDAESTAYSAKALADNIIDLAGKTEKSSGDHQLLASQVAKLNEIMPELGLTYDEVTGKLSLSTEEIYSFIEAQKEMAIQTAFMNHLGEAYAKLGDLLVDIAIKENELKKIKTAFDDLNEAIEGSGKTVDEFYNSIGSAETIDMVMEKYPELKDEILSLAEAYEEANGKQAHTFDQLRIWSDGYVQNETKNLEVMNEERSKHEEHISGSEEAMRESFAKTDELKDELAENDDERTKREIENYDSIEQRQSEHAATVEEFLQSKREAFEDYQDTLEKTTQDHWSAIGNMESEGIEQSDLTVEKAKENLQKQLDDYMAYQEVMAGLQQRSHALPPELLKELEQEYGPQYTSFLQELLDLSDEELGEFVSTWEATHQTVEEGAQASTDRIFDITADGFEDMNQKLIDEKPKLSGKAGEISADIYSNFDKQKGPIGNVGTEYGVRLGLGMSLSAGIPKREAFWMKEGISTELKKVDSVSIGQSISQGVASGIRGHAYLALNAAASMAAGALSSARTTLDSRSPSRKGMLIGKELDQGVALGIEGSAHLVEKSSQLMANAALGGLKSNLAYDQYHIGLSESGYQSVGTSTNEVNMTFNFNGGSGNEYEMFKKFESMIMQNQTRIVRGLGV